MERGVNKKYNTPFTVLYTVSEFDEYALKNRGAEGHKVESTYIRGNIQCKLEDKVRFVYQPGFNNEAVVTGIEIINI